MVIKSGEITRFKFHLTHINPHSKKCLNVPPKVKKEMRQLLVQRNKEKAKKPVNIEEIQVELRGTMICSHRHLVDDDDDDDDEDEEERVMSICIRLTSTLTSELTIEQYVVYPKLVNEIDNKKKGL